MPRRSPLPLLLAALLAVAAGCGGSDDDGAPASRAAEADRVLEQTFSQDKRLDSGRFSARLRLDGPQPTAIAVSGRFATRGAGKTPAFELDAEAGERRLGAVSTGERGFLRRDGQAYAVPSAVFAQFADGLAQAGGKPGAATRATLGLDPRAWLRDPRLAGETTVGGVRATRVTADLDGARFLAGVRALLERIRGLGLAGAAGQLPEAGAVRGGRVELDSGVQDRTLRRLVVRAPVAGGGPASLEYTLTGLNEPQRVVAPRDAKPLSALLSGLG